MTNVTGLARAKTTLSKPPAPKVGFVSLGCAKVWPVAVD